MSSVFLQWQDGEEHKVQVHNAPTFRANLYRYARRHHINAKSYIDNTTIPHPTVVFRLGEGKLGPLTGAPPRGNPNV